MTYKYLYQDKKNVNCEGEIKARNREDAYRLLRKQGIRPYRVIGDDPWNWRPWAVVAGYCALFAVIGYLALRLAEKESRVKMTPEDAVFYRSRAIDAVNHAPEAYRRDLWTALNARLIERGLQPLPEPEDRRADVLSPSVQTPTKENQP